uniref:Secretory carrier-associated membrane protein n=1 Tax=Heterorhabditis bacteriophora TaxID=37862 RepID=A0A1I7WVT4_HETBA
MALNSNPFADPFAVRNRMLYLILSSTYNLLFSFKKQFYRTLLCSKLLQVAVQIMLLKILTHLLPELQLFPLINLGTNGGGNKPHNWPPIPTFIPIEPCFYQVIFFNCGVGQLLLAIIQLALFSPCSFLFWFRPVYKAFRNDSSFNFMVFFFVLFFHSLFTLVQTLGVSSYACGWINTLKTFSQSVPVALIMLVSSVCFTAALGGMVYALLTVHKLYRGSGFSIDKARQEFTNGVMSDRNVQQATNAATSAAAGAAFQHVTQGRF